MGILAREGVVKSAVILLGLCFLSTGLQTQHPDGREEGAGGIKCVPKNKLLH